MAFGITANVTVADRLIADFGLVLVDGGETATVSAGKIAFAVVTSEGMDAARQEGIDPVLEGLEPTNAITDAPSAGHYNNVTYAFNIGGGSLQYSTWNGTHWSARTGVGVGGLILTTQSEPTAVMPAYGPCAVVFNGLLYVFYQGTPSGSKTPGLYYSTFNGTAWCDAARLETVGISCSPCAVVFNDRLYVFHQGAGYNGQLWYCTFDGNNWAADKQVPGASMSVSPAAAVYDNKLFVLYQDGGHNGQLLYNTLVENWSSAINTNSRAGISAEPCAIVSDGELLVFHQGAGNSLNIHVNTFNGNSWSGDAQLAPVQRTGAPAPASVSNELNGFGQGASNAELPYSPSTVELNNQLYGMYPGQGADEVLYQSVGSAQSTGASPGAATAINLCRSPSVVAVSPTLLYAFYQQDTKLCYATCDTTSDRWTSPYLVAWPSATTQPNTISLLYTPSAVMFTTAGASTAQIYLFYHAIDDTPCGQLWYVIFDPATTSCSSPVQVANASLSYSPAAVVFNNELYVFYQGAAGGKGTNALLYDHLSTAGAWSGSRQVPGVGISFAPAPVIYNDHLYVFFQGESANQPNGNLYYDCLSSAGTWSGASQLSGVNLSYSPAVIVYNDQVDVFFQGLASGEPDGTVYCAWLTSSGTTSFMDDPAVFSLPVAPLSLASWDTQVPGMPITYSPAAAVCQEGMNNEKIYVLHQGGNGNGQLWFGVFDGTTWSGNIQVNPQVVPASPCAVNFGNMIYSFYKQTGQLW